MGERRSAPLDSIVDRTLKALGIRTRAKRRAFPVKQIGKAIRQLSNQGILHEYSPDKFRLLHDKDSEKVQKLIARAPAPWPDVDEESQQPDGGQDVDDETAAEAADLDGDEDEEEDQDIQETWIKPRDLPMADPLGVSNSHLEEAVTEAHTTADADEEAALDRLLGTPQPSPTFSPHSGLGLPSSQGATSGVKSVCDALQILAPDLSLKAIGREASGAYRDGTILVELRRDHSLRVMISFSKVMLPQVLRRNSMLWRGAPLGVDDQGNPGIYRSWPTPLDAGRVAAIILDDVQFIEDSTKSS
jgi:hypothetical protein